MTRRIAILLTSTDTSDFARRHPNDGEKFTTLLQPLRPDWTFDVVSVKDGEFPDSVESYDGYVITGSPASVNGPEAWIGRLMELIREIDRRHIPMFGACFGHQAIAVALGGSVTKSDKGWGLGTAPTHFDRKAPWMEPFRDHLTLFAAHQEQVEDLPEGTEVLGGDDFCPVGAYRIGDHIFATEYHPEMTYRFVSELLDELDGKLDADTLARARVTLEKPAEGAVFAEWIVKFLEYRPPQSA
jgi:GMP synthase-like glutamine amidotransferase